MDKEQKVFCVLCNLSKETKTTGPLSTKDQVTAHQNCLLFSSGIYCRNSPLFDDLFGFSVVDVMNEVKRGSKLLCSKCKRKGATAGCEVKRCKKSYHYPCAVQEGAQSIEDADKGKYGLYCIKHSQQTQENNSHVNKCASSFTKPGTSKTPSEASSSKVYCLACEKTEGNISLESLCNSILVLYCDKHAPTSQKRNNSGSSAAAGPSVYSSDSSSSSRTKNMSSKRRLAFSDKQEESPSKRKSDSWKRIMSDSSDSDEHDPNADMEMYAPLDSDLAESANSVLELQSCQLNRKDTESSTGSKSGYQLENERQNGDKDEDVTDAESESLLPVRSKMESQPLSTTSAALPAQTKSTARPSGNSVKAGEVVKSDSEGSSPEQRPVPQQSSAVPPPSPVRSKPHSATGSPPCTSSAVPPAPPDETICVSILSSSPESPAALPSDPEPSIDSISFWKSCNMAGCTQNIFADFINQITDISSRIQSDLASQEDYDLALKVMEASGILAELVTKQQKVLQRKQMELQTAAAAMNKVVSALKR